MKLERDASSSEDPDRKHESVFDRIRRRCREVAAESANVRIVESAIPSYARALAEGTFVPPRYDETLHYRGQDEDTVAYVLELDAVNFGSGYFPFLTKRPGRSGYATLALSLADRFRAEGPLTAQDLVAATPADCARLFGQHISNPDAEELMTLFAMSWNGLGRELLLQSHGSFTAFVEAAEGSAARLVSLLDRQPLFRDVATYRGSEVPFYKRAQILVSDLDLALGGLRYGRFSDLSQLTIFADNLVPHVLRRDGVLEYTTDLVSRIERSEPIVAGSAEEVEIRACAVDAAERVLEVLRSAGRSITARDLDALLWNRGQTADYKRAPRHRTRTTAY